MNEVTNYNKRFEPLVRDVLEMKTLLHVRFRFPLKVVDMVVDFAEYWPHTSTIRIGGAITVRSGTTGAEVAAPDGTRASENQFLLRTHPLGYLLDEVNPTRSSMTDRNSFSTTDPRSMVVPKDSLSDMTGETVAQIKKNSQIRGDFPCRKIVFTIKSHDQGWGGVSAHRGTYKGSFTWFDVGQERLMACKNPLYSTPPQEPGAVYEGIINSSEQRTWYNFNDLTPLPQLALPTGSSRELESKEPSTICSLHTISPEVKSRLLVAHEPSQTSTWFSHALMPDNGCLQKNLTATRRTQENIVTWRYDDNVDPESSEAKRLDEDQGRGAATKSGEYIRGLKIGDTVTVWSKARFPGWVNTVEEVRIDVYWAV